MAIWRHWEANDYLAYEGELLAFETPDSESPRDWPVVEVLSPKRLSLDENMAVSLIFDELSKRSREVELGVLLINRSDGKTEIHFINNERRDAIDGNAAISPLSRTAISADRIASVQFFHNHPSRGPLSRADIEIVKRWSKFFGLDNTYRFPFHMYSVSNFDGKLVVFHYGSR